MDVWRSESGRTAVVAPVGDLDLAEADKLRQALLEGMNGSHLTVLDLAGVSFMDTSVLGVVVGAVKRSRKQGQAFLVLNAHGEALRVMQLTGLDALLRTQDHMPRPGPEASATG